MLSQPWLTWQHIGYDVNVLHLSCWLIMGDMELKQGWGQGSSWRCVPTQSEGVSGGCGHSGEGGGLTGDTKHMDQIYQTMSGHFT